MNENDDVMGFDDEPNITPEDSYIEPDLPETQKQTSAENPEVTEALQQDVAAEPSTNDYAGYEGFEAMDSSDIPDGDLNAGMYQENTEADNQAEKNNEEINDSEESQAKKILDTKPSEKTESKANKNNGLFLNRQRLLLIFAGNFYFSIYKSF